jgi:uncharacterized membrane protein YtjA (UPF0391 family)
MSYLFVFVLGIAAATVGFSGIAKMADSGVQKIQKTIVEIERK